MEQKILIFNSFVEVIQHNRILRTVVAGLILIVTTCGPNNPPKIKGVYGPRFVDADRKNDPVRLICEAEDPDNDLLTYTWLCQKGLFHFCPATMEDIRTNAAGRGYRCADCYVVPLDASGEHVIKVIVSDGKGGRDSTLFKIQVLPLSTNARKRFKNLGLIE